MKRPVVTLVLLVLFVQVVKAQVSFAPVDSLEYNSAGRHGTFVTGNTYAVDFNTDGYDDLIFLKGNYIFLRLNTGTNTFGEETLVYTDEEHIYSISNFADINNDTYPDLAIATNNSTRILYASENVYVKAHEIGDVVFFGRLILVDKNKDGKLDLASSQQQTITIYDNAGAGLQNKSTFYTDEGFIHNFGIEDLNADNELDLIVSTLNEKIKIHFGNSDGTLTSVFSRAIASIAFFQTADLNLDGYRDVTFVEWNENLFTLIYNSSSKTFTEAPVFPEGAQPSNMYNFHLLDLKNNGTLDLVYNNALSLAVKENNGLGQFLTEKILFENHISPFTLNAFNLNNDGIADVVFSDINKFQVVSFKADGSVNTRLAQGYNADFWDAIYHDVDRDGFKDILSISRTGFFDIRWGDANYDYANRSRYSIPLDAFYGGVMDVNDDGNDDILITQESNSNSVNNIMIVEGIGDRLFEQARNWKYFPDPSKPSILDINNDGIQDVLTHRRFGKEIVWFDIENADYNEYFSSTRRFTIGGAGIRNLVTHDINRDGYADLLTANANTKNISILINNKSGNFNETLLAPNGTVSEVNGIKAFDYNDDDHDDLLVLVQNSPNDYYMQVFLNDNLGNFSYHTAHSLDNTFLPDRVDVMDIDGDEDLDFIVSAWDYLSTNVFIRENGMMTNIGSEIITNCGQSARFYEDLNNDGTPDVFSANFTTGSTFIQLNNSVLPPPQLETEITIDEIKTTSVSVTLGTTTASGRLVVITRGEQLNTKPSDNFFYTSNPIFGLGSKLATNAYVVHAGTEESLEITGLASSTNYLISVFEYNVNESQVTIINYTSDKVEKAFTTLNTPPEIAPIPDQTGTNLETISLILEITDPDNLMAEFDYDITSSNHDVVPVSNIAVITTGAKPVLEITPIDYGVSLIEVTVTDTASNKAVLQIHYASLVVGNEENRALAFSVYPNPFSTKVEITHSERNHVLVIYNSKGDIIKEFDYIPETMDLSEVPAGMYFFRTSQGYYHKVVKH